MSHITGFHKTTLTKFHQDFPTYDLVSDATKHKTSKACVAAGCGNKKGFVFPERAKKLLSIRFSGSNNPFFGKKHSVGARGKMSANHADVSGDNNPFKNSLSDPKKRESLSKRMRSTWMKIRKDIRRYEQICKNSSERVAALHRDNKIHAYGKGHIHGTFKSEKHGREMFYRSSYELAFLELCEKSTVGSFDNCKLIVPYCDENGRFRSYLPDFSVGNTVVEIKPLSLLGYRSNRNKFAAGKKFCADRGWSYVVLTEKELSLLGKSTDLQLALETFRFGRMKAYKRGYCIVYDPVQDAC
jgi:hypothetical protein